MRVSKLNNVSDFIELFDPVLTYCCMKEGLLPYDPSFMTTIDIDLLLIVESQLQVVRQYVENMWLPVYDTSNIESIVTVDDNSQTTYVTKKEVESPAQILKKFVVCTFSALRSIIEYATGVKESEKACPHFLNNLLRSFGLYDDFFVLPIPVHRKLARALVHLYKFKGSKYSAQLLLGLLSFARSYVSELYSYRIGPQYDHNYENLYFELLQRFGADVEKLVSIHFRQVIDKRWFTHVVQYSNIYVKD